MSEPQAVSKHHDVAFATGDIACVHDSPRGDCDGCTHDAAIEAESRNATLEEVLRAVDELPYSTYREIVIDAVKALRS